MRKRRFWHLTALSLVSPYKRGRGRTMTRDYKRNGVTTLFAALNILDGKVLSMTDLLHRHQGWLKFLNWKYVSRLDSF
jgi:hypothetical protein